MDNAANGEASPIAFVAKGGTRLDIAPVARRGHKAKKVRANANIQRGRFARI